MWRLTTIRVSHSAANRRVVVPGGSVTGNDKAMRVFSFADITTTKIRVVVNNARNNYSRIVEVEAFSCGA